MNSGKLRRSTIAIMITIVLQVATASGQPTQGWKAHDIDRPQPTAFAPGSLRLPVPPPPGSEVLFSGGDLSRWTSVDGSPPGWEVSNGAMISVPGSGYIQTKDSFGDIQLHLEWSAPKPVEGKGQGRGNSGVYLMGRYEIQVLDSYQNPTYPDGQAASVYGQYPPLFNVALAPGEWQSYDIFFSRPRFSRAGALLEPARVTVLHNNVVVQNNVELWGPTSWLESLPYEAHADSLPLALQDHGNPVRYRNIWVRRLPEPEKFPQQKPDPDPIYLSKEVLDRYAGEYETEDGDRYALQVEGTRLLAKFYWRGKFIELVPRSAERFDLARTEATLIFQLREDGVPRGVTFHIGGESRVARKVR